MRVKLDIGKALRLLGHPVVGKSDRLDGAKAAEAVTHVIFLEAVGETLDEEGLAI